jgi:hypothetical protein
VVVIDRGHFWDDAGMVLQNGWRLMAGGVLFSCVAFGCAAEQVDELPEDSGKGAAASASGAPQGGSSGAGGAKPTSAGTPSSGAPSAAGKGGTTGGTAGSPTVAGTSAGGNMAGSGGSGPTKPANTNLPFSEDFEDGEANGFIPWNEDMMAGAWGVVADGAGKVYQPAAAIAELEFAVGGSTTWTDVAFTVRVRLNDAESGAQIVLRFKEPKTYLVVEMAVGKFKLRGRADGSTTDLVAPSPKPVITAGTWYKVGVTAKGNMVSLLLDDMPIGSPASAAAAISNGGIALGVAEGSVSYDDVSVTAAP